MRHLTAAEGRAAVFGFYFTEMTVCTAMLAFAASIAVEK